VYDEGFRLSSPFFTAFCLRVEAEAEGPKVGFTVPRAVGKSVVRNRMKRRMREAVRLNLAVLPSTWRIVFNPRRPSEEGPFENLQREVRKVFEKCANS